MSRKVFLANGDEGYWFELAEDGSVLIRDPDPHYGGWITLWSSLAEARSRGWREVAV